MKEENSIKEYKKQLLNQRNSIDLVINPLKSHYQIGYNPTSKYFECNYTFAFRVRGYIIKSLELPALKRLNP